MIGGSLGQVSNRATWEESVILYDTDTGDRIELETDIDNITITIRDTWSGTELLTGDLDDGTVFLDSGGESFNWRFTADQMATLDPKTYEVGVRIEILDWEVQAILGRVSVLRGL